MVVKKGKVRNDVTQLRVCRVCLIRGSSDHFVLGDSNYGRVPEVLLNAFVIEEWSKLKFY